MYPAQIDFVDDVLTFQGVQSLFFQPLERDLVGRGVNFAVDFVAGGELAARPREAPLGAQARACPFRSARELYLIPTMKFRPRAGFALPHKLDGPFHFPFGLPTVRPAQNGLEAVKPRKVLKLPVQRGILLFQQPLDDHVLHVVV